MWGVSMAGEGKERKAAKVMIHDEVQGEEVPFSFPRKGGEEMRTSALVFWSVWRTTFYILWMRITC